MSKTILPDINGIINDGEDTGSVSFDNLKVSQKDKPDEVIIDPELEEEKPMTFDPPVPAYKCMFPVENSWEGFMNVIEVYKLNPAAERRVLIGIDPDLNATLKEIQIVGLSKANLVNAILRQYINCNIDNLRQFRSSKEETLFEKSKS